MKVLLINPLMHPKSPPPAFPLGLAYVAGTLLREGHQVDVWDIDAMKWTQEEVLQRLGAAEFEVAGITGMLGQYRYVKWLVEQIKGRFAEKTVVLGGPLATLIPELMLKETRTDVVVNGEGEDTARDVLSVLQEGGDLRLVRGITFRSGEEIVDTGARRPEDIDSQAMPAWHLFPMDVYLQHGSFGFDETTMVKSMDMITSRGCPYHCIYCFHGIFGHQYRLRSVDSMIEEMKLLNRAYGTRAFVFRDDTFVVNRQRVLDFCQRLIDEDLGFLWACNGRVNLIDSEMLSQMRRSGCILIGYGIESGSQMIMDKMNRKTTVEQAKKALKLTWQAGITPRTFFMMGMPWESEETIDETVDFCKEVGVIPHISFITPIPGTPLYEETRKAGKVPDERSLVEGWENWAHHANINLTSFTKERLEAMKSQAEADIRSHLVRKRRVLLLRRLYLHFRTFGVRSTVRKVRSWLAEAA